MALTSKVMENVTLHSWLVMEDLHFLSSAQTRYLNRLYWVQFCQSHIGTWWGQQNDIMYLTYNGKPIEQTIPLYHHQCSRILHRDHNHSPILMDTYLYKCLKRNLRPVKVRIVYWSLLSNTDLIMWIVLHMKVFSQLILWWTQVHLRF